MEKIFRVKNGDGYVKEFTDEKAALEFEAKVKKEQEEHAKAVAKAEAERKAREEKQLQFREEKLVDISTALRKDINAKAKELSEMIKDYEKATNRSLYCTFSDDGLVVKERTRKIYKTMVTIKIYNT